ncbi:MAG: quaternary ammonium compound efflux SMR transporter SugE [Myxococcales bacterium]
MAWVYLAIAGLCEIGWAVLLKYSEGFTRLVPSMATVVVMIASFVFLSFALRGLPLGTAYAIWTGIGAMGVAIIGMFAFGESHAPVRLLSLALVIMGGVGLKISA